MTTIAKHELENVTGKTTTLDVCSRDIGSVFEVSTIPFGIVIGDDVTVVMRLDVLRTFRQQQCSEK